MPIPIGFPRRVFLLAAAALLVSIPASAQQAERVWSRVRAPESPAWVREAVVYEIFPRAFSPAGNFDGVTARLDELKELGVTTLWIMPIHPCGQVKKKGTIGSPYAVRDYYAINPDYGTKKDFRRLVDEAHRRGLKVILDMVANHTSWDSVLMEYPDFYAHDEAGKIIPPIPTWLDVAELDYRNPKLQDYMINMMAYWLKDFDLDGFRCDVASEVPTEFWERARDELGKFKPDLFLLAEASQPDILAKAFNADYAWPFHTALDGVMAHGRPASALRATWEEQRSKFPRGSLHLRFSDNHDEQRAIARFGARAALAASALVFTMDGIPLLYNGMEVGDTAESGDPALFERLPIFWGIAKRRPEFPLFYRQLIALRRAHPALRQGETKWLPNSDEDRVVTYSRLGGGEEFLVAINLSNRPFVGVVEVDAAGFTDLTPESTPPAKPDVIQEPPPPASAAPALKPRPVTLPALALDAWGFRILRRDAP